MEYYGIDISHWNGKVNFSNLGKDFVIMKVSQVQYKDPKFEEYYDSCKVPKGAYIYNKVKNVTEAKKEAEFAVKALSGRKLELGVWLDLEDASMRGLGKNLLNEIIANEVAILTAAGYHVGIYCNYSWYTTVLDSDYLAKYFPFWIARYPLGDNGRVKENLSPKNLKGCKIWQYSSKGIANGIVGNVDMNICYVNPMDIFGIPDSLKRKTNEEIALEVIDGLWGNGDDRKQRLAEAGYNYSSIQKLVNQLLRG